MQLLKQTCTYRGKTDHPAIWPCDVSVVLAAKCGDAAAVDDSGQYTHRKIYSLADPTFLQRPSQDFTNRKGEDCKCEVCYVDSWITEDMGLAARQKDTEEQLIWTFFGNFWLYNRTLPKIPADSFIVAKGASLEDANDFCLKFSEEWQQGYLPHQETACYTSWDHEQIEDTVKLESARRKVPFADLRVYVGRVYENWH